MANVKDDVVRLALAANPTQAHIWEQALREEGIDCRAVGDYLEAGLGDISGMQPELWVHRQDLERARAVLEHRYQLPPEKPWQVGKQAPRMEQAKAYERERR